MKKIILLVYFLGISYLSEAKTLTCADEPCVNGKCIEIENSITRWAPYVCECKPEWFGANCDKSDSIKSDGHFKANAIKLNTESKSADKSTQNSLFQFYLIGAILLIIIVVVLSLTAICRMKRRQQRILIKKYEEDEENAGLEQN